MKNLLVWLEWPERCFRAEEPEIGFLRRLCPDSAAVSRVRSEEEFLERLPGADAAIVWHFKKEWFALAPRLELLATPSAGRELVAWRDAPARTKVHFGGFHGAIISETVAGFVLASAHGFFRRELAVSSAWRDDWPRVALSDKCSLVAGTRAVIAGYGKVGRAIGAKLAALGVEVSGFGRSGVGGFREAAATADWLVLALPGDTGTDGFLDAETISLLPRRCTVINVGRGNAVDEDALLEALREGRIAGAYLDVFRGEPGAGSPDAADPTRRSAGGILALPRGSLPPNLVMTPHSSAFCAEYLPMCFKELKDEGLI